MTTKSKNSVADVPALSALVFGGTGVVGRSLLEQLLADGRYAEVRAAGRSATGLSNAKLCEQIVDMGDDKQLAPLFAAVDQVFCCLGTTIKIAGSKEQFRAIDYELPIRLGKLAKAAGTPQFTIVSAMGADAGSKIFYNRVKGEMQRDLAALGLPALDIVQPSLLLGSRDDSRPGEALGKLAMPLLKPLLQGRLKDYRGIQPAAVAEAMIDFANQEGQRGHGQSDGGCAIHQLGDYA